MKISTKAIITLIALAVVVGAASLYLKPVTRVVSPKTYENPQLGISFTYPANYIVEERELGNGERRHYSVMIVDEVALQNAPMNGEGPTAITFDFYQNNLDKLSPVEWVKNTNDSNFKLNGALVNPLTIDGQEALTYTWDGLYRGTSSAITHGDWILVASVTSLAPEDQIIKDFTALLGTLKRTSPAPISGSKEEDGTVCIQVITMAQDPATKEVKEFPTPCDVPAGWLIVEPE